MNNPERITYPFDKRFTCIIGEPIKCECPCHGDSPSIMHFMACCNDGYITNYTDILPIEIDT